MTPAIIAVDPGEHEGCALLIRPAYAEVCSVDHACDVAMASQRPIVLCVESHTHHGRWARAAQTGLAERVGHLIGRVEARIGLEVSKTRKAGPDVVALVRCPSNAWARMIGAAGRTDREGRLRAATMRARAELYAFTSTQRYLVGRDAIIGPDDAVAVCIALWAERAPDVAKRLPRR